MSVNPRVSLKQTHNNIGRLTQATSTGSVTDFSYDKAGNNQNHNAIYNILNNQMKSSDIYTITYDSMGNIKTKYNKLTKEISTYTFNSRNQLIQYVQQDENNQTKKTLTYTYDAFNRRVSKTDTSAGSVAVTQKYLYDGDDIVAILDNSNAVIATITHDESIDTPLSITNSNGTFYYHRDHQGSIIDITDSSGVVVESFTYDNHYGTITNHTKTTETNNPYAYTGRELDTDELYYYRARYYDPQIQRFLGEDPIGFGSGDFNRYRYVGDSPLNYNDPSGKFLNFLIGAGLGAGLDLFIQLARNGWNLKCVNWYSVGASAALGALGVAGAGTRGLGKEFSHWIPNRAGGPRSIWNGNYVPKNTHALSDPYRYRFMPRNWKVNNPMYNPFRKHWVRFPNAGKGVGAGAVLGFLPNDCNSECQK